jgi:branched-chain amino acid transport system substrate-binding protein
VQIIKQAIEMAGKADPKAVSDVMLAGKPFKTVIGDISYDKKGDITRPDYVIYTWRKQADDKITYVED